MNTLSLEQAREILQPHFSTLERVMQESLEDLNRALGTLSESANNRAKSALLHSIAIEKAKKYFSNNHLVSIVSKYQSIQIIFSNKIVGRIKKVDSSNYSRNARTKRNDAILMQQTTLFAEFGLEDLVPTTFVDLGYKLDDTGSEYDRLNVICRKDKLIEWHFSYKGHDNIIALGKPQLDPLDIKPEKQIMLRKKHN